jgi:hypothetical protein
MSRRRDVEDWFVLIINCRDDQMSTGLSEDEILTESRNRAFKPYNIMCPQTSDVSQ